MEVGNATRRRVAIVEVDRFGLQRARHTRDASKSLTAKLVTFEEVRTFGRNAEESWDPFAHAVGRECGGEEALPNGALLSLAKSRPYVES